MDELEEGFLLRDEERFLEEEEDARDARTEMEFSVCQFFQNGEYEYVRRFVGPQEAVKAFQHYTTSVGARIGTTVRVIITDGGDCINMEWVYSKGLTFPPRQSGQPGQPQG